jgi:hypothetical protein
MDKRDVHLHDAPSNRMAELIKLILVVLGAILLFIGWYNYLT